MGNGFFLPNMAYKTQEEMPDVWSRSIDAVDEFISDLLHYLGIKINWVYTSNVGMFSVESADSSTILWDLSYVTLYQKYLDFVFWLEKGRAKNYNEVLFPLEIKQKAQRDNNYIYAHRLSFLSTIFDYLANKFYSNDDVSYCFALLHNENNISIVHPVSDEESMQYNTYMAEHLSIMKIFWAFHEAHHLEKIRILGDDNYRNRILSNVKTVVDSAEFSEQFGYDLDLVDAVRARVKNMGMDDPLFNELFADAGALDCLDLIFNYMDVFKPSLTSEKFAKATKEAIENFYAFNTLLYELFYIWNANIELAADRISKDVYHTNLNRLDVEDVIRSCVFPMVLWIQVDLCLLQRNKSTAQPCQRQVNIRQEMINLFDLAYNDYMKDAIISAIKGGFCATALSVQDARNVLIGWDELDSFNEATEKDLFLKGVNNEVNFYMFVRGY